MTVIGLENAFIALIFIINDKTIITRIFNFLVMNTTKNDFFLFNLRLTML